MRKEELPMKKLLMPFLMAMILLATGCSAQEENETTSIKATISSVENGEALASIKGKEVALDLENALILVNDCIVNPSFLHDNDTVLCTYSKGSLRLVQVIENTEGKSNETGSDK